MVKIGSGTAEILMTLSLCGGGGGGGGGGVKSFSCQPQLLTIKVGGLWIENGNS